MFVTLSLSTLGAVAREIKVYVRSVENIALATNAWNSAHKKGADNDTWETPENYGGADAQTASTETTGGKTWYCHTYDLSKLAAEGDTFDKSYFNLQFHTLQGDKSWWSGDWGIENNSNGTDRLPSELFFVIDKNATKSSNGWLGIHEITRAQAAETDQTGEFGYYLMGDNGNRIAKFEAVRNQNQGLHTMSGNSFAATIWSDNLFTSTSTTTAKFYVKAYYKKKSETNYKLGFYRLKNATAAHPERAKTSPHRAYLQLPGDVSGGTTPTAQWDQNISFKEGNLAKAQIYNAFKVEYPDWNNDVTTGIKEIPTDDIVKKNLTVDDNAVYDIAGRVVSTIDALRNGYAKLPKGIYIFNGKKFIVR